MTRSGSLLRAGPVASAKRSLWLVGTQPSRLLRPVHDRPEAWLSLPPSRALFSKQTVSMTSTKYFLLKCERQLVPLWGISTREWAQHNHLFILWRAEHAGLISCGWLTFFTTVSVPHYSGLFFLFADLTPRRARWVLIFRQKKAKWLSVSLCKLL